MGAWNFTTGLVLLVVILNNIRTLEALPKGNSSDGQQSKVFPDFRQFVPKFTEEDKQVAMDFEKCAENWGATVGEPCSDVLISMSEIKRLATTYLIRDIPTREWMKLVRNACPDALKCSACKCKCEGSSVDSSSCNGKPIPEQNFKHNCDKVIKPFQKFLRRVVRDYLIGPDPRARKIGDSKSDPCARFIPSIPTRVPDPNSRKNRSTLTFPGSSKNGSCLTDPGQYFQYIILMAVILFVLTTK